MLGQFYHYALTISLCYTEVVLNLVLSRFEVSTAKQADNIVWNNAGVRHPTMKDSIIPTFPVELERIRY